MKISQIQLLTGVCLAWDIMCMAGTHKPLRGHVVFSKEDQNIIARLMKKFGVNRTSVIRMALRHFDSAQEQQ